MRGLKLSRAGVTERISSAGTYMSWYMDLELFPVFCCFELLPDLYDFTDFVSDLEPRLGFLATETFLDD